MGAGRTRFILCRATENGCGGDAVAVDRLMEILVMDGDGRRRSSPLVHLRSKRRQSLSLYEGKMLQVLVSVLYAKRGDFDVKPIAGLPR
jgi:hypothetical protein